MKIAILLAATLGLAFAAPAQSCGTLAVSGGPTTPIVFTATNLAADAPAILVLGPTTGSTVFRLGVLGTLTLGLESPFVPLHLGTTSPTGGATATLNVPARLPSISLHAQAFSVVATPPTPPRPPSLTFCTTNVVGFTAGS